MISSDANDVIPVTSKTVSKTMSWSKFVVTAVPVTGAWILLSTAISALAFWLVALITWELPRPTELIKSGSGTNLLAFSAVSANFNLASSILITKSSLGSLSVEPTPETVVVTIPTAIVVPVPACV